jgi:hypothetical protein
MRTTLRNTLLGAALGSAWLAGASAASAQDAGSTDSDTGFQEEQGTYPLFIDGVSAVMRIADTYASVTTRVDRPAAEDWHLVMLDARCDGGVIPNRAIVLLSRSMKVTYSCPNPDPALYPPEYFIESARATLTPIDDETFDPNAQRPSNSPLVTVEEPGPDDVVPPRPESSEGQP